MCVINISTCDSLRHKIPPISFLSRTEVSWVEYLFSFLIHHSRVDELNQIVIWVKETASKFAVKHWVSFPMYKNEVQVNISIRGCLPQDWLISHHGLKRVQKINRMGFWLSISVRITLTWIDKNAWIVRNTKIHKGFVIGIM